MIQFLWLLLGLALIKIAMDYFKKDAEPHKKQKKTKKKEGEVIDISEAWINTDSLPYKKVDNLLANKEMAMYQHFVRTLKSSNYTVIPRVQLFELLNLALDTHNRTEYINRAKERNVDLVVFENDTLKPVLLIKFEDNTDGKKKKLSDQFTEKVVKSAGYSYMSVKLNNPPDEQILLTNLRTYGLSV